MPLVTLEEFVEPIPEFDHLSVSTQTDLLALYQKLHGTTAVTASLLASFRESLHLPVHSRLPQYLSEQTKRSKGKIGRYVKTKLGYALERAYSQSLSASHLGRQASRQLAQELRGALASISDVAVRTYLEEAIGCFEQNHFRSSIVMEWCVAYGTFRSWLYQNHLATLNKAMSTWKTPFDIQKMDDFQELTESTVIDTARKVSLISKEQHKTLRHLLDQRNSYAHPTMKLISPVIAEAYIEAILKEVLPTFG